LVATFLAEALPVADAGTLERRGEQGARVCRCALTIPRRLFGVAERPGLEETEIGPHGSLGGSAFGVAERDGCWSRLRPGYGDVTAR
jgi:hypothetical protein